MLTLGKIGGTNGGHWRQASYYTDQVAQGAEDYYSGKGEAPGAWAGCGAANLGLDGQIADGELQALLGRQHPRTGVQLGRSPGERSVRGIDVQMAMPKSVSTLWALADEYGAPQIAQQVWDATHGAAGAALDYLERHACNSRAGAGGHISLRGEGFVAAVFPHRFSREGDPQIHVHVLVANMTACGDPSQGVEHAWRTLDARDLYRHQRAAGYLFQAELRERLTRALGVEWTQTRKGAAEIVGVPRELITALSRRRAQILDALDRDGRIGTPAETQLAALSTRKAKQAFDLPAERERWRALAEEHGFGPDELHHTLDRTVPQPLDRYELIAEIDHSRPGGLTAERRRSRAATSSSSSPSIGRGSSAHRAARRSNARLRCRCGSRPTATGAALSHGHKPEREPLFTTAELLDLEAQMLDQAIERTDAGAGRIDVPEAQRFERRPAGLVLSDEQRAMVEQLVTSGAGVEIVRAKAGTGKTTAIDAARDLWERGGYRVIGTALSGRAADELRARGGMDSYTLHGLLAQLERGSEWALGRETVVVVDEAAMVDTRRLARLLDHAADARAKVVLIGDERQVPAVEAGGAFAALADRLGAIELDEVHRQRHAWDHAALDQLRHGDISAWAAAYEQHGRLVPCRGADQQLRTLVEDWYVAAREHGFDNALMLAPHRHEVDDLNQLARAARIAAGDLDDTNALIVASRVYPPGDRVLALRNRRVERADDAGRHQLRNGNLATVIHVDRNEASLTVALDSGTAVTLPTDYLRDGHLAHGYATTIHKAQGMTTQRTFVLASPGLARELGYVASSRHTDEARFYVNTGTASPERGHLEEQPFYADLVRTLGQERAKHLALDQTEIDTHLGQLSTAELLEISDRGQRVLTTIPAQARRARDAELLAHATARATNSQERLTAARAELEALGRFQRRDREILQRRVDGLEAALTAARRELTERTDAAAGIDADRWVDQHEMTLLEATAAERELADRRADAHWRATQAATLDPDPAIERNLGPRPDEPAARERWKRTAAAYESYQLQYGELPTDHDLADLPSRQAADWRHAHDLARRLAVPLPDRDLADRGP